MYLWVLLSATNTNRSGAENCDSNKNEFSSAKVARLVIQAKKPKVEKLMFKDYFNPKWGVAR